MKTIQPNDLDASKISPSNGGKYSPNLYQWLRAKNSATRVWTSRVYRDASNTLWLGVLDGRELFGSQLMDVLSNGSSERSTAWQNIDAVEVPDFWVNYTAYGRCAIDVEHGVSFPNDEYRWRERGDSRSCQWCGNVSQRLKRWTEMVQREAWETVDRKARSHSSEMSLSAFYAPKTK